MASSPVVKQYDDGLQVHNADDGLYAHNADDGLHLNENHPSELKVQSFEQHKNHYSEKQHISHTDKEVIKHVEPPARSRKRRKRRVIGITVGCLLVIAIVLGVGLGVSLRRSSTNNATTGGTNGGSTNGPSNGTEPNSSGVSGVMNSSSLAAVMNKNRLRFVFYQNNNNSIGCSVYNSGLWTSSIAVSNARKGTPISAILVGGDILLFSTDQTNMLQYSIYDEGRTWRPPLNIPYGILDTSTSISVTPVTCKDAAAGVVLFFEDATRIRGLYGASKDVKNIIWNDFSSNLRGDLWSGLGSPITTGNSYLDNGLTLNAFFFNKQSQSDTTASILREFAFSNFSTCQISSGSSFKTNDLSDALQGLNASNDLIMFPNLQFPWFIINGSLSSVNGPGGLKRPDTQFPFTRLAAINATDSQNLYLYTQLNETMLLENIAINRGQWKTNNIPIAAQG